MRRVLPLHKRGNRLFVAVSDPANLQVLDEVRFRTNLVVDAVVVEDDKLSQTIAKVSETTGQKLSNLVSASPIQAIIRRPLTRKRIHLHVLDIQLSLWDEGLMHQLAVLSCSIPPTGYRSFI